MIVSILAWLLVSIDVWLVMGILAAGLLNAKNHRKEPFWGDIITDELEACLLLAPLAFIIAIRCNPFGRYGISFK
jgi:hypothetical protein